MLRKGVMGQENDIFKASIIPYKWNESSCLEVGELLHHMVQKNVNVTLLTPFSRSCHRIDPKNSILSLILLVLGYF